MGRRLHRLYLCGSHPWRKDNHAFCQVNTLSMSKDDFFSLACALRAKGAMRLRCGDMEVEFASLSDVALQEALSAPEPEETEEDLEQLALHSAGA